MWCGWIDSVEGCCIWDMKTLIMKCSGSLHCCIWCGAKYMRDQRSYSRGLWYKSVLYPHPCYCILYTSWLLLDLLRTAETASNYHLDPQKSTEINWDAVANSLSMCANMQGVAGLARSLTQINCTLWCRWGQSTCWSSSGEAEKRRGVYLCDLMILSRW